MSGAGVSTSSTLLHGVRARDPEAWGRFMALYRPLVLYWCQREGLQSADAEDMAQEVFQAVAGGIDRFRHEHSGDTLRGWLRTIARNKIRDRARRAAQQPPTGGIDAHPEAFEVTESFVDSDARPDPAEERIVLRQAIEMVLAGFKDHTRRAFWRVVVDGQTPDEVARELGIEVHSVYLAKSRVLRRLREEFAGHVDQNLGVPPDPSAETTDQT